MVGKTSGTVNDGQEIQETKTYSWRLILRLRIGVDTWGKSQELRVKDLG